MVEERFESSCGSTYSTASTEDEPCTISDSAIEGLKESAPLLFKGTEFIESPTPWQSWKAVIAVLRGPQRLWVVFLSSFVASICAVLAGYTLGYPSKAMLELSEIDGDRGFNNSLLKDLFGALAPFGAVFGGGVAGWSSEGLGRKPTLILSLVPNIIGYLLIATTRLINCQYGFKTFILTGRFLSGFAMGWSMLSAPMYIAEISPSILRGLFSAMPQLGLAIGILLVYCVEALNDYAYTACVGVAVTAIFAVLSIWLLETPRYLVKKGKIDKALINLKKLRGPFIDAKAELNETQTVLHEEVQISLSEFFHELKKRSVFVPLILLLFILSFQQLSGINPLIFYAAPILHEAHLPHYQFTALLAIGITEVVTTCLTVFIVDLFGRKVLLLLSCVVMCVSCAGLGTHLYVTDSLSDCTSSECANTIPLAVASVIIVILGFSLGLGAIPWTLVTEIVPLRVRGPIGGLVSAVNWFFAALVTGFYFEFAHQFGDYSAWWTFAGINLFAALFVALFLPETKNKRLEVIERQIEIRYRLCSWR